MFTTKLLIVFFILLSFQPIPRPFAVLSSTWVVFAFHLGNERKQCKKLRFYTKCWRNSFSEWRNRVESIVDLSCLSGRERSPGSLHCGGKKECNYMLLRKSPQKENVRKNYCISFERMRDLVEALEFSFVCEITVTANTTCIKIIVKRQQLRRMGDSFTQIRNSRYCKRCRQSDDNDIAREQAAKQQQQLGTVENQLFSHKDD